MTAIRGCKIECVPASCMTPQDGTNTKDQAAKCCEWDTAYMMATKKKRGASLWWMQGALTSSINSTSSHGEIEGKKKKKTSVMCLQCRYEFQLSRNRHFFYYISNARSSSRKGDWEFRRSGTGRSISLNAVAFNWATLYLSLRLTLLWRGAASSRLF